MTPPTNEEIQQGEQSSIPQQEQDSPDQSLMKDKLEQATRLETFPSFSKLPNELQDMIWGFALFPQVIRLDLEGGNTVENDTWEDSSRILFPKRLTLSLLQVCQDSRKVAQKEHGEKYTIVSRYCHPELSTARSSPSVHFRPLEDTIYLPERKILPHLACYATIGKETEQDELRKRADCETALNYIRSLAVGGLLQRIIPEKPGEAQHSVSFSPYPEKVIGGIDILLSLYPRLEQLILVSPTVEELSAQAAKICEETSGALCQIFNDDISECRIRIHYYLNRINASLVEASDAMIRGQNDPLYQGPQYSKMSDWWRDPVVIWMTEPEFEARFGLKPVSGDLRP